MKNGLGLLFVLLILYCLAALPAFFIYAFVGSYIYPFVSDTPHDVFIVLRIIFMALLIVLALSDNKKYIPFSFMNHFHLKSHGQL